MRGFINFQASQAKARQGSGRTVKAKQCKGGVDYSRQGKRRIGKVRPGSCRLWQGKAGRGS